MNLSSYTFVALDLETTGLSQEKDAIIEVAAVKFQLERDGDIFRAINLDERTMLIDPLREIDEHISMITGITNEMVKGKPQWLEVRERVKEFIGDDTIIVWHNVLFDISMLQSHGVHLKNHITLDTFELSEIFSWNVESLNLWFLAKHYGFDDGSEHRALDDTKLSLKLFLYYLWEVSKLQDKLLSLWEYTRKKDESITIDTLLTIVGNEKNGESWKLSRMNEEIHEPSDYKTEWKYWSYSFISLNPSWEEEKMVIDQSVKKGKLLILTSSKKQSFWLKEKLSKEYRVSHIRERKSYISEKVLNAWLSKPYWKRKETILIIRLIHWLHNTKTGSIDEIKWYGDEWSYKFLFSLIEWEETGFLNKEKELQKNAQIIITESYNEDLKSTSFHDKCETCIIRDIWELGKSLQYRDTLTIDWEECEEDISKIQIPSESKEDLRYALSVLESIVTSVVARPTGPQVVPPWEYGETYFFSQKDLWHRGYIWLIWAVEKLEKFLSSTNFTNHDIDIIEKVRLERLRKSLWNIIELARIGNPNRNLILEIKNNKSRLILIPRYIKKELKMLMDVLWIPWYIFCGYGISTPSIEKFIKNEYDLDSEMLANAPIKKISIQHDDPMIQGEKIVILGTNLKQLRTMSATLSGQYKDYDFFTQGISGGKSKMLHLFLRSKKSILLGLIDTWKDESFLWENTNSLSITKIPFDPPNDPYYLARTVGMPNNFEIYSIPMAINTINTLIWRAKSSNSDIAIYLCDEKLKTMSWWKNILPEIF